MLQHRVVVVWIVLVVVVVVVVVVGTKEWYIQGCHHGIGLPPDPVSS